MLRICLVALLAFVAAANVILEFEEKIEIPAGWSKKSAFVDESKERTLYFAVKRQNMKTMEDMFWRVSDPRHADYGKYLTFDQLGDLIRPKQEHIDAVDTWLASFGLNATWNQHFDYATVKVPVAKCKQMFGLEFSVFQHESGKRHVTSLGPYFVPEEVAGALDLVSGLVGFPLIKRAPPQLFPARPKPQPSPTTPTPGPSTPTPGPSTPTPGPSTPTPTTTPTTTSSGPQIGPTNLRTRYNVTDLGTNVNNRQAVAEFQQEYFAPKDLATFWTKYVNYASSETVYKTVGANKPGNPGLEASLDVQYIASVAPGVQTWFWSTPSMDFWTDLTAWAASIANTTDAPWVHSVSYGSQGQYPSATYQNRLDGDFQTFGNRGISIIFASGDSGCGCKACAKFQPSFPATSIYVTSVGATRFISGTEGPEEAVTEFGSGGGMSLTFATPSYQQAAVSNYFSTSTNLPAKKFYNAQGRGTPDVSALGWGFDIVVSGQSQPVGGTSASTPTFAAIISLLNDQQLNAGRPTLGFLNQWIYQTAANVENAFWDVTEGNNKDGCCPGFQCAPGWDPVTGVGTPNYEVLKTALP